ncbi:hypothetical protein NDU88_001795 [Pleurodeles waltl]|uniref:Uncharacterized protein n=1 Tax=Pleurodeles waltl TaxID=8319 RepID=A0AAV7P880_PLEWA|nr:hypothetical protein NDU88_001795 [Pleurodeles waltl]
MAGRGRGARVIVPPGSEEITKSRMLLKNLGGDEEESARENQGENGEGGRKNTSGEILRTETAGTEKTKEPTDTAPQLAAMAEGTRDSHAPVPASKTPRDIGGRGEEGRPKRVENEQP